MIFNTCYIEPDEIIQLAVHLGPTDAQLRKITKLIDEFGGQISKLLNVIPTLNTVTKSLDVQFLGMIDSTTMLNKTISINASAKGVKGLKDLRDEIVNVIDVQKLLQVELDKTARIRQRADEKRIRDSNASLVENELRQQFPIPAGTSLTDAARLEVPIQRIKAAIEKGLDIAPLLKSIVEIGATGTSTFERLNATTISWIRSIVLADANLAKLAANNSLPTIQARISTADAVMQQFTRDFSQPLSTKGFSTDRVDALIAKLGILTRESGTSQARIQQLFDASTKLVGGQQLLTGLTKEETQIINLIQRIKQLHDTAINGSNAATTAQNQFNAKIQAAQPIINNLVAALNQAPKSFSQLASAQSTLNNIVTQIGKGTLNAQQLQNALNTLNSGGGKKPPTTFQFLPPGGGGDELAAVARLMGTLGSTTDNTRASFLNLSSVFRIFQVQVLHQTFGQLLSGFQQATGEASKFQIKISEIRTLSQETQVSFAGFTQAIRLTSDSFGLPILDVAKAAYDAISNQVTRGAETVNFLNTSLQFARVTVSSATDAVNLLSSVIKSYGENNITAQRSAEILFKVIDLGRVTASELANTFGRVAAIAATVGVSQEELGAAIATLTVRGVKYSEAYTLINNVLLKLIRPTEEMTKLLKSWGVDTGEAAIATFGFVGVLRRLQAELSTGGVSRLGELERDIRAIRGVLGLVQGDAFQNFEQNLIGIRNGAEQYRQAIQIIGESSGFKFEQELNKIKNFFTVDFGAVFIDSVLKLSTPFGGLSNLVITFTKGITDLIKVVVTAGQAVIEFGTSFVKAFSFLGPLIPSITTLTQGYIAYRIATTASALATSLLNTQLGFNLIQIFSEITGLGVNTAAKLANAAATRTQAVAATANATATAASNVAIAGLVGPIGIAAAAIGILTFTFFQARAAADEFNATLERNANLRARAAAETADQNIARRQQQSVDDFRNSLTERFQQINQYIANVRRVVTAFADASRRTDNTAIQALRAEGQGLTEQLDAQIRTLTELQKEVEKDIKESQRRILDFRNRDLVRGFEQSLIDAKTPERAELVLRRVREIRAETQAMLSLFNFNDTLLAINQITLGIGNIAGNIGSRLAIQGSALDPQTLEEARKKYEDIDKILTSALDKQRQMIDQLVTNIRNIASNAELREFERDISRRGGPDQTRLTLERIENLRSQGISLFDSGNIEDARKKFEEIDKLLTRLFERQQSARQRAEALGVRFTNPLTGPGSVIDERQRQNDRERILLEQTALQNAITQNDSLFNLQRQNARELIALEELRIATERRRYQQALGFEAQLRDINRAQQSNAQEVANLVRLQADAENRLATSERERNTNLTQFRDTLQSTLESARNTSGRFTLFGINSAEIAGHLQQAQNAFEQFNRAPTPAGVIELQSILERVRSHQRQIAIDSLGLSGRQRQLELEAAIRADDIQRRTGTRPSTTDITADAARRLAAENETFARLLREINSGTQEQFDRINTAAGTVFRGQEAQRQLTELTSQMERFNNQITTVLPNLNAAATTAGQAQLTFNQQVAASQGTIITNLERIVQLYGQIGQLQVGLNPQNVVGPNIGPDGLPRRAAGGTMTDDTLYWGNKNEFVVNAASSQKFKTQLIAMNAGFEPVFSRTDSSQSISVGDININAQGNKVASTREFWDQVRREIRRGNIKL